MSCTLCFVQVVHVQSERLACQQHPPPLKNWCFWMCFSMFPSCICTIIIMNTLCSWQDFALHNCVDLIGLDPLHSVFTFHCQSFRDQGTSFSLTLLSNVVHNLSMTVKSREVQTDIAMTIDAKNIILALKVLGNIDVGWLSVMTQFWGHCTCHWHNFAPQCKWMDEWMRGSTLSIVSCNQSQVSKSNAAHLFSLFSLWDCSCMLLAELWQTSNFNRALMLTLLVSLCRKVGACRFWMEIEDMCFMCKETCKLGFTPWSDKQTSKQLKCSDLVWPLWATFGPIQGDLETFLKVLRPHLVWTPTTLIFLRRFRPFEWGRVKTLGSNWVQFGPLLRPVDLSMLTAVCLPKCGSKSSACWTQHASLVLFKDGIESLSLSGNSKIISSLTSLFTGGKKEQISCLQSANPANKKGTNAHKEWVSQVLQWTVLCLLHRHQHRHFWTW